jgi:hypothetical protein
LYVRFPDESFVRPAASSSELASVGLYVGQVTLAAYHRLGGTFEQAGVRFVPGKTALMMDCLSTDS